MPEEMPEDQQPRRAWFGPKRIGWGVRPQTWQGWAVTALFVIIVVFVFVFVFVTVRVR